MDTVYTLKALEALRWCAEQDHLNSVTTEDYRDESDVGWIKATIKPHSRGNWASGREPVRQFKVSPLGHVYDFKTGEILRDAGPVK